MCRRGFYSQARSDWQENSAADCVRRDGFWGFKMCLECKSCWFQNNLSRLVSPSLKKLTLTKLLKRVFHPRDILGEPGERKPVFVVDLGTTWVALPRKRTEINQRKGRLWTAIFSQTHRTRRRRGVFSPHPREKDGFTHMVLWMFTGFSPAFSS